MLRDSSKYRRVCVLCFNVVCIHKGFQNHNNIGFEALGLMTLFNIVEERLKKLLNFDVSAV